MDSIDVQLGLGLLSLGRRWGFHDESPPDHATGILLLETAIQLGIKFYDTAPAYGSSELRFGGFLRTLPSAVLQGITIATKFGEHWDEETMTAYTDHSYGALVRSVEH